MKCEKPKSDFNFNLECIQYWASQYNYRGPKGEQLEDKIHERVKPVRTQKYLTKCDLNKLGEWKSPRSAGNIDNNEELFVSEVTQFALNTKCDRAAIESLTILDGVGASTASAILHFFHEMTYPIMDFRALWSVSLIADDKYNYSYALWSEYVKICREEAKKTGVCMRILDRALWQYSKCKQPRRQTSLISGMKLRSSA